MIDSETTPRQGRGVARSSHFEPPSAGKAARLLALGRPIVIGHRGAARFAPENTLASFEMGLKAKADMVELDYHHSRDEVPVVIHDPTLARTTDATQRWGRQRVAVGSRDIAELKLLDAGRWFGPSLNDVGVPTLHEALTVIQHSASALIEHKAGDALTCLTTLKRGGWAYDVMVQSFDWDFLRSLHALDPDLVFGALGPPPLRVARKWKDLRRSLSEGWVDVIQDMGARVVGWNRRVTAHSVAHAHHLGMKVFVYTVNEPSDAHRLLDLGVDGLISDDPALMNRVVASRTR